MGDRKSFSERFKERLKTDAAKTKRQLRSYAQELADADDDGGDDSSGGGPGKRHRGNFGKEKVRKLIDRGVKYGKQFQDYINRELDSSEVESTEVSKDALDSTERQALHAEEQIEQHAKESRTSLDDKTNKKSADAAAKQWARGFMEKQGQIAGAIATTTTAKTVLGANVKGGHGGFRHGNHHGYVVQSWIGTTGEASAEASRMAIQGNTAQGVNYGSAHGNPYAFANYAVVAGSTGNVLDSGVKKAQVQQKASAKAGRRLGMGMRAK